MPPITSVAAGWALLGFGGEGPTGWWGLVCGSSMAAQGQEQSRGLAEPTERGMQLEADGNVVQT